MKTTIRQINQWLKKNRIQYSANTNNHFGYWYFELDGLICHLSCEQNKDDFNIPTVSIVIELDEITKNDINFVLALFRVSSDLINSTFSSNYVHGKEILVITRRVSITSSLDIKSHIHEIFTQAEWGFKWASEEKNLLSTSLKNDSEETVDKLLKWGKRLVTIGQIIAKLA